MMDISFCNSKVEALKLLGLHRNNTGYKKLKEYCLKNNIDINLLDERYRYKITPTCCKYCNNLLEFKARNNLFCSRKCSASFNNKGRIVSEETKIKISNKIRELFPITYITKNCLNCNNSFTVKKQKKNQKFCSVSCRQEIFLRSTSKEKRSEYGRKSVSCQQRRSKNEILFANLCKEVFNTVLENEPIFNGWDADVILPDKKVAILWNGVWHYKQISKKQSLSQVQNRDKIKEKEIIKAGYTPYIIVDMGKHNPAFVKEEFNKFIKYLAE